MLTSQAYSLCIELSQGKALGQTSTGMDGFRKINSDRLAMSMTYVVGEISFV